MDLMVLGPDGATEARTGALGCPWPISGGIPIGSYLKKIGRGFKAFWHSITSWPEFDTSGIDFFPYLNEPTPAIVDSANLVEDGKALVAIADNMCNLIVFRYDGNRLERLWRQQHPLEQLHGSPLVTSFGQLVIGDEEGKVRAFDVDTGRLAWTYDAGEPVLGTPASVNQPIYVPTRRHVHVVNAANGHRIARIPVRYDREVEFERRNSPAVSSSHVHIAAPQGLTSIPVGDWRRRAHDTSYRMGYLSQSPAIGPNGELYVIHENRELWAYAAT